MSFERPPLAEIIRRDTSDFEYELGSQAPRLPGTPEYAFVRAHAGVAHGLHGRIDRVRRDAFLATSSDEAAIQKAAMYGVFQIPAGRSSGTLSVPGEVGTVVPAGTAFVRDDGVVYTTMSSAVCEGEGVALAPSRAAASGAGGNMTLGTSLVLLSEAIAGLDGTAVASGDSGWQNGVDAESTVSLRRRLAQRLASPPKGGGPGDYVRWALGDSDPDKVPPGATPPAGVTRAWEYGKVPKVGNVTVLFMRDNDDDPFPSNAEIEEVKAWIMLFAPIALPEPFVFAPNPKVLDVEFSSLTVDGDLGAVKAAILQSLKDMIALRAAPPKNDTSVFYKSWINEAVSKVPGEVDHKISSPAGDLPLAQWDLVTLGEVTWP